MTEEKAKKVIVATTVGAVLLLVFLLAIMAYQMISIKVKENEMVSDMLSAGNGARFQVCWKWNARSGHATVAEVHDGKVYFIDPQTNTIEENDCSHMWACVKSRTRWARVDNADIDIDDFTEALIAGKEEDDD